MSIFLKRIEWLKKYVIENGNCFDVLNLKFVDEFIIEFNALHDSPFIGARHCQALGKFLSEAYKKGYLSRGTISIKQGPGFPNWVYGYSLLESYLLPEGRTNA